MGFQNGQSGVGKADARASLENVRELHWSDSI